MTLPGLHVTVPDNFKTSEEVSLNIFVCRFFLSDQIYHNIYREYTKKLMNTEVIFIMKRIPKTKRMRSGSVACLTMSSDM